MQNYNFFIESQTRRGELHSQDNLFESFSTILLESGELRQKVWPFCLRVVYNFQHDLRFTSAKRWPLKPGGATTNDSVQYCPHFYVFRFWWFLLKSCFWTTLHHFLPLFFASNQPACNNHCFSLVKSMFFWWPHDTYIGSGCWSATRSRTWGTRPHNNNSFSILKSMFFW